MYLTLMKSKIHRATVTGSDLGYMGSITVDSELMRAGNMLPYEQVDVLNLNNGARFTTYLIEGDRGEVVVNGAAARLVQKGDLVILCCYGRMDEKEAKKHEPLVVHVDDKNAIRDIIRASTRRGAAPKKKAGRK